MNHNDSIQHSSRMPAEETMPIQDGYVSVTALSTAANFIMNRQEPFTHTYRAYIRAQASGRLKLRLWHSNAVDSTWDKGQDAAGGEPGGRWRIEAAYIGDGGLEPDGTLDPAKLYPVTFGGSGSKEVEPGEKFSSDEVTVDLEEGHYLVFSWTLTSPEPGKSFPYNVEDLLASAYDAPGTLADQASAEGFQHSAKILVLPSLIGCSRPEARNLIMLGDSITQGVRTAKDAYEYWAARISAELGPDYGVWNIGSGWGRAYDAAAENSPWLYKAKFADEMLMMLGVNDLDIGERSADELWEDLTTIISRVKAFNPDMKIMLSTVPPFNFAENREKEWRSINERILNEPPAGADRVFNVGDTLSCAKPEDHRIQAKYMSNEFDPHPNGAAGAAVAEAFLKWYRAGRIE
ncbi:SGNH/GDSL hydrolase family protein [Paenibacillus pinistramenti]|uniref:SGNH/GDSL hydrolase family protein n=1 Tax=Paenibacillus pinistramenti TaxID=1768003 RepID=UPI001EEFA601|nr:SGNH/GDSL hydrolase family protein [Paenibacillus pinistramenti]